ncbi:MAG: S41 family peptidase [Phycisphaerae bacterium]
MLIRTRLTLHTRSALGLGLCALALGGCAERRAAAPTPEPQLTLEQSRACVASFDKVWELVRDRHWDPALGGLDWNAVRDELRPQAENATTLSAARRAMNQMIARLGQSHFQIIAGDAYVDVDAPSRTDDGAAPAGADPRSKSSAESPKKSRDGGPGFDCRPIDGQLVVTRVEPGSHAAEQGVRPGWVLTRIGGEPVQPLIDRLANAYANSSLRELMGGAAFRGRMLGPPGETLELDFLDADDRPLTKTLARTAPRGVRVQLGHLPPMHVWFESRRLDGGVGYIAFNLFMDPGTLMPSIEKAVAEFQDAPGIVLDIRGNVGGIGGMAPGITGWFVERTDPLGQMTTRQGALRFAVNPRAPGYRGPLAVLIDGASLSTAEILAGGLKDLGRARLFGSRTGGAALPSVVEKLPNGDVFQYAIADYVSAGGERLEGVGVAPHEPIALTRVTLLRDPDPVLSAAVKWILSQGAAKSVALRAAADSTHD